MNRNRVVISAMGITSPIGTGKAEFFEGISSGKQGISTLTTLKADYFPSKMAAEARQNNQVIKSEPDTDRREVFLELIFNELIATSGISAYPPEQRMLITGSGLDFFNLVDYAGSDSFQKGEWHRYSNISIKMIKKYIRKYQIKGGCVVNISACVASSQAIGLAFRMLRSGEKKAIVAGGMDSVLNYLHYMGFYKLGALSDWQGDPAESCRPFDIDRGGLVLGEGAVIFLLENAAKVTDQNIMAEIVGYDSTMDAYMATDPLPGGELTAQAALNAIADADITPDRIDYVNMHGTGTPKNDIAECNALKIIFGERYRSIPVFSLKSQVGHLIGACGAIEIASVIYSLEKQVVPPTVNFANPDPEIPLNVLKKPLSMKINYVLKLSAGFGGQNSAFVIKRYE